MPSEYKYDVVFSYAGENEVTVDEVVCLLRQEAPSVRLFYAPLREADLWGKDLAEMLPTVFREEGRYCVMFISEHYAQKLWPTVEKRAAIQRAVQQKEEYILPVRLDGTQLPGLSPTIHYYDMREKSPKDVVNGIKHKLGIQKEEIARVEEQIAQLTETRSSFTKVFKVAGPVRAIRQLVEATKVPGIEAKYYGCHTPGQDANIKLYIGEVDVGLVKLEFIDSEEKTQGTISAELKAEQMGLAEDWYDELLGLLTEAGYFSSANRLERPVGSDLSMVTIDVRHGVQIGNLFVRELEAHGFRTKELSAPLTVNSLSGVRVLTLFVARPDHSGQPLTSEEITTIQSFVAYGGGLFLIGLGWVWKDYGRKSGLTMDDYPLNKISYPQFGTYFRGEYLNDPRSEFEIREIAGNPYTCAKFDSTNMREHPITAGVRKIFSFGLSSTLQVTSPSIPLVWDGNDQERCVLAAWHMQGQGRVVCLQHEGYFKDDNIHKFDNLKLLINIVQWLSQSG